MEGKYNIYMLKVAPCLSLRHVITGVCTIATIFIFLLQFSNILLVLVFSYSILAFISSISQPIKYKNLCFIFILPFWLFYFISFWISLIIELIKFQEKLLIKTKQDIN